MNREADRSAWTERLTYWIPLGGNQENNSLTNIYIVIYICKCFIFIYI